LLLCCPSILKYTRASPKVKRFDGNNGPMQRPRLKEFGCAGYSILRGLTIRPARATREETTQTHITAQKGTPLKSAGEHSIEGWGLYGFGVEFVSKADDRSLLRNPIDRFNRLNPCFQLFLLNVRNPQKL